MCVGDGLDYKLIDTAKPSSLRVVPFPRQGILDCTNVHKYSIHNYREVAENKEVCMHWF